MQRTEKLAGRVLIKEVNCPACHEPVIKMTHEDGEITYCDKQRRMVIFDKPIESTEDLMSDKLLSLIDEKTGKHVIGRKATKKEVENYKKDGNPGKPFTIGHKSHLFACQCWNGEYLI